MAQTGLQLRRDIKSNLEQTAIRVGEIVFATDTSEIGMIVEGTLKWMKLGEIPEAPEIPEINDSAFIAIPDSTNNWSPIIYSKPISDFDGLWLSDILVHVLIYPNEDEDVISVLKQSFTLDSSSFPYNLSDFKLGGTSSDWNFEGQITIVNGNLEIRLWELQKFSYGYGLSTYGDNNSLNKVLSGKIEVSFIDTVSGEIIHKNYN
jgi:hypothetical protein